MFVSAVHSLEAREVPAVFGMVAADAPALTAPGGTAVVGAQADDYLKIKLTDILISSYSVKSSPGLMM